MRRSSRDRIVAGALTVIERDGVDGLTFEALAEQVGLTRGGIVYHFRTREDLVAGIASDLLARWKAEALEALGKPFETATRAERITALAVSVLDGVLLPGELAFLVSGRPEAAGLNRAWDAFQRQWVGDPRTLAPAQRVGLLAVSGWWVELASGKDRAEALDAGSRELSVSLVSGERGL